MEKQRVNDAVVKLGNLIIKARIFVVHRLSAKIRALRQKSQQRFNQRIERLLLEIAYLKTLSKSGTRKKVARKILLSTDDHAAKIENESTTPEQRAFHRLCKTKFIESFIAKFREENIDWNYWVPALLAMWEKKVELKNDRISKRKTEEPNRVSVRDVAAASKRKAGSNKIEDRAPKEQRTNKSTRNNFIVEPQPRATETKAEQARKQFKQRTFDGDSDDQQDDGDDDDDDDDEDYDEDAVDDEEREKRVGGEESNDEDHTEDPRTPTRPTRRISPGGIAASEAVGHAKKNGDNEESEESSSSEMCQVPFRPYAPKYFVGGSGSENSNEETDGSYAEDESASGTSSDNDESERGQKTGLSVKQLEEPSDNEEESEEDSEEDEEDGDDDDDDDSCDEESDSDREREFEAKIENKFKSAEKPHPVKIQMSAFEPDSSEEEFPTQQSKAKHSGSSVEDSDDDKDAGTSSLFFLSKNGKPQDIQKRTIPKEKAPGLNRRQRRGHERQRHFNESTQDDSDAEPRSSITFGKDFRPRKSSQFESRTPRQEWKQPFRRDTDERRGPPREGWDSGNPSRNARRPLSGKYDSGTKPRTFFEKPNGPQLRQGVHRLNANKRQSFSVGPRSGQWAKRSAASAQRPERQKTAHQAQQQPGNTRDKPTAARKSLPQDKARPAASEEQLHPSWSAKKKMNASINQPFLGKKIVFE